jgi:hypothetical protein
MLRFPASNSEAGVPQYVFTRLKRAVLRLSKDWSTGPLPALRAFADGFGSGLIGGLMYWLLLVYIYPNGLEHAWLRVLAVSVSFGGFEMWRVARNRKREGA